MTTTAAERVTINADGVTVIPDRATFLDRIAVGLRTVASNTTRLIKRAWGWIKNQATRLWYSAPMQWVATKTASAAMTVWGWGRPTRALLARGATWLMKSPYALWTAALGFGLIGTSTVLGYVCMFVAAAMILDLLTTRRAPVLVQAPNGSVTSIDNGSGTDRNYSVKLTDEMLDPQETIERRFEMLEELSTQAETEGDADLVSEIKGRENLLLVRRGVGGKLKKNASVSSVHKEFRKELETRGTHLAWTAAYRGAQAEDARLSKVRQLKAEHDALV